MYNREYPRANQHLKVIYHATTSETARNLARGLGIGYRKTHASGKHLAVVRWGTSYFWPKHTDLALQPRKAVRLAADGLASLERLSSEGVPCVEIVTSPSKEDLPLIGRAKHNHVAGSDITVMRDEVEPAKYYTKFRPSTDEFRVHVWNGKVLKMFRKTHANPSESAIKTSPNGWGYYRVDHTEYYQEGQAVAVEAVKALGLHYGGVDLGKDDAGWYVFEVNTGPALNTKTIQLYIERFREHLGDLEVGYEPI